MNDWCVPCPLAGRRACPQTREFIRGCKEFSEKMKARQYRSSNRKGENR